MSYLEDLLRDLEGDLAGSNGEVGGNPGPLDEPERGEVDTKLGSSEVRISQILVEIDDVGLPNKTLPNTLPLIAQKCEDLAEEALAEGEKSLPNHVYIGTRMKTIRWLINTNNGYRDRAGL